MVLKTYVMSLTLTGDSCPLDTPTRSTPIRSTPMKSASQAIRVLPEIIGGCKTPSLLTAIEMLKWEAGIVLLWAGFKKSALT